MSDELTRPEHDAIADLIRIAYRDDVSQERRTALFDALHAVCLVRYEVLRYREPNRVIWQCWDVWGSTVADRFDHEDQAKDWVARHNEANASTCCAELAIELTQAVAA